MGPWRVPKSTFLLIFLGTPILAHFGLILGLIWRPIWCHFGNIFGTVFLLDFRIPFFIKACPKGGQKGTLLGVILETFSREAESAFLKYLPLKRHRFPLFLAPEMVPKRHQKLGTRTRPQK